MAFRAVRTPLLSICVLGLVGCAGLSGRTDSPSPPPTQKTVTVEPVGDHGFDPAERSRIVDVQPVVTRASARHGVDRHLINGVIWVESRFQPRAKSPAGARGLMQLMPGTSKDLAAKLGRPSRPYDPEFNVEAGSLYLSRLLARYDGDETLALAAYNAGPGNVNRWLAQGGLPETSLGYARKVLEARERMRALHRAELDRGTMLALAAPTPVPAVEAVPVSVAQPIPEHTSARPTPPELPPLGPRNIGAPEDERQFAQAAPTDPREAAPADAPADSPADAPEVDEVDEADGSDDSAPAADEPAPTEPTPDVGAGVLPSVLELILVGPL